MITRMPQKLLIIGGNGYVGSAICRVALSRGWEVTSLSPSGQPWRTPKGHLPAWTSQVTWLSGSTFDPPDQLASHLENATAVASTVGTLLPETGYKSKGNGPGVVRTMKALGMTWGVPFLRNDINPLEERVEEFNEVYDRLNRDAALNALKAFQSTQPNFSWASPFIFISAEDIFRPFIPARYIESKREAEKEIDRLCDNYKIEDENREIRPVYIRPSLIYHPHIRPLSTLPAVLTDLSSSIQSNLPEPLKAKTIAEHISFLRQRIELSKKSSPSSSSNPDDTTNDETNSSSSLPHFTHSFSQLLSFPPIHVDTVAEAVCRSIENPKVRGPLGVEGMRKLVGWEKRKGEELVFEGEG